MKLHRIWSNSLIKVPLVNTVHVQSTQQKTRNIVLHSSEMDKVLYHKVPKSI